MTMTCHATAHPSHPLMLRPQGNWFQWSAWYFWVTDFMRVLVSETRGCATIRSRGVRGSLSSRGPSWPLRLCLWHAPAVVTNAIATNCARTFAAPVPHSTRVCDCLNMTAAALRDLLARLVAPAGRCEASHDFAMYLGGSASAG